MNKESLEKHTKKDSDICLCGLRIQAEFLNRINNLLVGILRLGPTKMIKNN
jgi:hypothetical protein